MRLLALLLLACGAPSVDDSPLEAVVGESCGGLEVACAGDCTARCSDAGVWYVARCSPKCGAGAQVVSSP